MEEVAVVLFRPRRGEEGNKPFLARGDSNFERRRAATGKGDGIRGAATGVWTEDPGPTVVRSGERNGTATLAVPGLDLLAFRALGFEKGGGFLGTWARYAWFGRNRPIRQGVARCACGPRLVW